MLGRELNATDEIGDYQHADGHAEYLAHHAHGAHDAGGHAIEFLPDCAHHRVGIGRGKQAESQAVHKQGHHDQP